MAVSQSMLTPEVIQAVFSVLVSIGMAVGGWFIRDIYAKFNQNRENDRELYQKIADTRELVYNHRIEGLQEHISLLNRLADSH